MRFPPAPGIPMDSEYSEPVLHPGVKDTRHSGPLWGRLTAEQVAKEPREPRAKRSYKEGMGRREHKGYRGGRKKGAKDVKPRVRRWSRRPAAPTPTPPPKIRSDFNEPQPRLFLTKWQLKRKSGGDY